MDQFLARDDWAGDSVSNFELAWGALTGADREVALRSVSYRRFSDVLRRRLVEAEALSGAGQSPGFLSLLDFAQSMDMPYAESLQARTAPAGQAPSQVTPEAPESLVNDSAPATQPPLPDEAPGGQTPQALADSSAEQDNGAESAAPAPAVQQAPEAVAGGPEGVADPAPPALPLRQRLGEAECPHPTEPSSS